MITPQDMQNVRRLANRMQNTRASYARAVFDDTYGHKNMSAVRGYKNMSAVREQWLEAQTDFDNLITELEEKL